MWAAVDEQTRELLMCVDEAELDALQHGLACSRQMTLPLAPPSGPSGLRRMEKIRVVPALGPIVVNWSGDTATLTGGPEWLARLAEQLQLFREHNDLREPGMHLHREGSGQGPESCLFSDGSATLVVVGPVPDEAL